MRFTCPNLDLVHSESEWKCRVLCRSYVGVRTAMAVFGDMLQLVLSKFVMNVFSFSDWITFCHNQLWPFKVHTGTLD